ncbi:hypothetical protein MNBD_DELTA03-608 [hydrothermal vent metagenome]|uniref:Cytochrome c7-like domain-containing protein n=1 Tax=hydrothermal vent metagenome TaxID=652676 RepID=A0A3B0UQ52_9ZZZZ
MKKLLFLLFACSILIVITGVSVYAEDLADIKADLADMTNGGDIVYTKPVKAVIFSHKAHVLKLGLQCGWCHDKTFQMEAGAMERDHTVGMASLCNDKYCGTCHNGDISFSTTTQCARCHIGVKGYNRLVKAGTIAPVEKAQENPLETNIKKSK